MSGKIFINYRRGDDSGFTGRVFDRLVRRYTSSDIFMDVDSIPPGSNFPDLLAEWIGHCDVFLSIIGRNWENATCNNSIRRLDDPNDFVRREIALALQRDIRVIPVLVNETVMPRADGLPECLKELTHRQVVRITHDKFESDTTFLMQTIDQAILAIHQQKRRAAKEIVGWMKATFVSGLRTLRSQPSQRMRNIVIIGPRGVGKTVYSSVLTHEPAARLSSLGFNLDLEGDSEGVLSAYDRLRSGDWPRGSFRIQRFAFTLRKKSSGVPRSWRITLWDTMGGEWTERQWPILEYQKEKDNIFALLVLIEIPASTNGHAETDFDLASTFAYAARAFEGKPIALVLTKSDRYPQILHDEALMERYVLEHYPSLWNTARVTRERIRFFAVSATGPLSRDGKPVTLVPRGIWNPIVWLVDNF
jgi:GTPase SAR1 family protein